MADMRTKVVIADIKTDGAIPVDGDIYLDLEQGALRVKCIELGIEIWLQLCDIGTVLSDELHG